MAEGRAPRVSVIIPTWNGLRYLRPCLEALARQSYEDFEVWVVDNASQDGTAEIVREEFPWVHMLALEENLGYAGGCNAGLANARGEIIVFFNNDIEADPGWLAALVRGLDRHPEAGSAASRIMLWDRRDTLHSAGDLYRRDGTADSRGVWQRYGPPYDREAYVFGGCGGALAYRAAVLRQIGPFERRFFMYCEDVDLNWRAQRAGWKCIYVPDAVVYHHLSATGGGSLASYYVGRNTLWVIARNYPGSLLWRNLGRIARAQARIAWQAMRSWRGAAARARLRGQLVGLVTCWRWLPYRWRQPLRVSVDELETILA